MKLKEGMIMQDISGGLTILGTLVLLCCIGILATVFYSVFMGTIRITALFRYDIGLPLLGAMIISSILSYALYKRWVLK